MSKNTDLTDMSAEEIFAQMKALEEEVRRRQTRDRIAGDVNKVIQQARESGAARTPEPLEQWVRPVDVTGAYIKGEAVTEAGTTYESTITPNLCIPGQCVRGWIEQPEDTGGDD